MKLFLKLIFAALFCLLSPLLASAQVISNGAGTLGEPLTITPIDTPDVWPPDGIVNPDFTPECEWTQGVYECEDFSTDYCDQFPGGRSNCHVIIFCGFPEKGCHAANITRTRLSDGTYLYCMVEPQSNEAVPGSCWVGDENWPRDVPGHLQEAICDYPPYVDEGLQCIDTPNGPRLPTRPRRPRIYPKTPWWVTSIAPVPQQNGSGDGDLSLY